MNWEQRGRGATVYSEAKQILGVSVKEINNQQFHLIMADVLTDLQECIISYESFECLAIWILCRENKQTLM